MKFLVLCVYCLFCLVCVFVILTRNLIYGAECNGSVAYMKRSNFAPTNVDLVLMFNTSQPGITEECFNRCAATPNDCLAFLVDYDAASCYRINTTSPDNNTIVRDDNHVITNEKHVNFFQRTCLAVPLPIGCQKRLWMFEVSVGSHLIGYDQKTVYSVFGFEQCIQLCLVERSFQCRSAGFYRAPLGQPGACVMNSEDRRSKPDSYSPTTEDVVYVENQCVAPVGDACAMNEFQDTSLQSYSDVVQRGITLEQCESLCLNEPEFTCRSFTFVPSTAINSATSRCSLHSEDTASLGTDAILSQRGAVYKERAACLDLLVSCSSTLLTVTLRTTEPFYGRLYANGFTDTCNADGMGANSTTLALPLEAGLPSQQCGVRVVRNFGNTTSTRVASASVVIQFNAIIQRLGDRLVRLSCHIDDTTPPDFQLEKNITFVGNNSEFGSVNVTVNATRIIPSVRIHIVDLATGDINTNQTVVGKALQLRLDTNTTKGDYDFTANSLRATNADGSASFLLLDSRGCPANPQFFPGLFRDEETNSYVSDFSAFKFPNSPLVRFQLQIQYCAVQCQKIVCGNGVGRQRRNDNTAPSQDQSEGAARDGGGASDDQHIVNGTGVIPLEFALVVLPDSANSVPRILANVVVDEVEPKSRPVEEHSNIVTINTDEYLCVPYVTSLGVLMGWIILQLLVFFLCACFVRWQLKRQDDELRRKLIEDFSAYDNFNKRVRWADNVEAIAL